MKRIASLAHNKKEVPRLLLLLTLAALVFVPISNAWCGTVCLAEAVSSGCGHALQPVNDLPLAPSAPPVLYSARVEIAVVASAQAEHWDITGKLPVYPPLRL